MSKAASLQTNFTAGELDPALHLREDLRLRGAGAARLENVIVNPQGGVARRPGLLDVGAPRRQVALVDLGTVVAGAQVAGSPGTGTSPPPPPPDPDPWIDGGGRDYGVGGRL